MNSSGLGAAIAWPVDPYTAMFYQLLTLVFYLVLFVVFIVIKIKEFRRK